MEWIIMNWEIIATVVSALIAVFVVVAKKTENKTDDKVAGFLEKGWQVVKDMKAKKASKDTSTNDKEG